MEKNVIQINGGITINVDVCGKNNICVKKIIFRILLYLEYSSENGKYLTSIIDDSVIMCYEIIDAHAEAKSYDDETKTILNNIICETKSFYILLLFLLNPILISAI